MNELPEKFVKRFVVEVENGFSIEATNEINYAVNGKEMALAILLFQDELKYRFKHREMSEETAGVYEEIFDLALEHFQKFF